MSLIDDKQTDGILFTWTIQNFSYCTQKYGERLESPSFNLDTSATCRWKLFLYPRGCRSDGEDITDFVVPGFKRQTLSSHVRYGNQGWVTDDGGIVYPLFATPREMQNINVHYTLSLRPKSGRFHKKIVSEHNFEPDQGVILPTFIRREALYEKGFDAYLDNDTLTLRWRVWKIDNKILESMQYHARTIISVERTTNVFTLEKFQEKVIKNSLSPDRSSLELKFKLVKGEAFAGDRIKLEITKTKANNTKCCFATCDVNLRDDDGKTVYSMRDEHLFEVSNNPEVWILPLIPLSEMFDSNKLFLRYELAVSDGTEYSWVESFENGEIQGLPGPKNHSEESRCSVCQQNQSASANALKADSVNQQNQSASANILKEDLFRLYSTGKMCDFTIRTPTKDFLVHKSILCARSEVFGAMFERDMQENRQGVVKIDDIDVITMSKTLRFIYTDIVEGSDFEAALKLYYAADKYAIAALKMKCSEFLKENLNSFNACDALVLANLHQDEDLEACVRNFIVNNSVQVMGTDNWKKFMQERLDLASEIMHMVCMKK